MYKFITEYKNHEGKLCGAEIYADSIEEAKLHLIYKKDTEKIIGYDPTIQYLDD
jgi:hypothetical protein